MARKKRKKESSKKKGKLLLEKEKEKQEEKLSERRGDESLINRHKGNKLPWVPDSSRLHLRSVFRERTSGARVGTRFRAEQSLVSTGKLQGWSEKNVDVEER